MSAIGPIVLKKSDGNLYVEFLVILTVQLTRVRAMAAVLNSRVTDLSFPTDTRTEFFNTIGPEADARQQCRSVTEMRKIFTEIFLRGKFEKDKKRVRLRA